MWSRLRALLIAEPNTTAGNGFDLASGFGAAPATIVGISDPNASAYEFNSSSQTSCQKSPQEVASGRPSRDFRLRNEVLLSPTAERCFLRCGVNTCRSAIYAT